MDAQDEEYLQGLAQEVLDACQVVAEKAKVALLDWRPPTVDAMGVNHVGTVERAMSQLGEISAQTRVDLDRLADEPLVARLLLEDEGGRLRVLFICENSAASSFLPGVDVASYRSPKGRLASRDVGEDDEVALPGGRQSFIVQEKARFRSRARDAEWDALDAAVARAGVNPVTVRSMRALVARVATNIDLSVLDKLLEAERAAAIVVRGFQRTAVQRMALRSQPILDKFQDDVFRLPLESQVVLMGPPGSGKTTTLIKRLGLKLDLRSLQDYPDDFDLVERSAAGLKGHSQSWIMFTPTELLKQYVKEAFNREGIPASELRMKTWGDYRRMLARTSFSILRTTNSGGAILREDLHNLLPATQADTISWYEDFSKWQFSQFITELKGAAEVAMSTERSANLGNRVAKTVERGRERLGAALFLELARMSEEIEEVVASYAKETRGLIDQSIAQQLRDEPNLVDSIARFLEEMGAEALEDGEDSIDGIEDEDAAPAPVSKGRREQALDAYRRAIAADARAVQSSRTVGTGTRNGKLLAWLGSRKPDAATLASLGRGLEVLSAVRRFRNPLRLYFSGLRIRYRRFRAIRRDEGRWYASERVAPADLGPLEVDVLLLAFLSGAQTLLSNPTMASRAREGQAVVLDSVLALKVNQVVVDEATDFSPVQLACMSLFVDPAIRGFLACGDFNQRMTIWGTRSLDELEWVLPGLVLKPITITYRHSRQLNDLSQAIASLSGDVATAAKLPDHVDNDGVPPALGVGLSGQYRVEWIAQRIREVERIAGQLPTIAVLVVTESEVEATASALDRELHVDNIKAVPCVRGLVVGQDNDIRVFAVEHIKGLEFEAVFFVDLDQLATQEPDLFEKRLYVGATRAAMFLGVTCQHSELPESIRELSGHFCRGWESGAAAGDWAK